jgi:D-alanyl-D-alanine dipeptidase
MSAGVLASCVGKKRYSCYRHAANDVRAMKRRGRRGLMVYRCGACAGFHVGHTEWWH